VVRGSSSRNLSKRSSRKPSCCGNCHRIGPSFGPSRSTPEAKKLASGSSTSLSFFMWVMKRPPLTANTKRGGVSSRHLAYEDGVCSE
jgi:hypothetical protein